MKASTNQSFIVGILETGMLIDQIVQKSLKTHNITHAQYNVLRILNGAFPEALCMKDVKSKMIMPASDLTRLADRLETKKLIIRGECPNNRRKINIMITPKGQELLIESWPEIKLSLNNFFTDSISESQAEDGIQTISAVKDYLKEKIHEER
ncbi:MAG: MarR family transcriptional regulator [Bacteroidota bacterium]